MFYIVYDKYMIYVICGVVFDYLLKFIDKKELEGIIDCFMKKVEELVVVFLVIFLCVYLVGEYIFMIFIFINDLCILCFIDIGFFCYNFDWKLWEVVLNN